MKQAEGINFEISNLQGEKKISLTKFFGTLGDVRTSEKERN